MTVKWCCMSRRPLVEENGCARGGSCTTPPAHTEAQRKQATFARCVREKNILHVDDCTDEELLSTWHGPKDRKQISQDVLQTLAKMESGELVQDDEHFCRRGLESTTKNGASVKKRIRLAASNVVLDEQEAHDHWQGTCNEQLISETRMDVTLVSKLAAARRGFDDLQEVIDQRSHFTSKKAAGCSSISPIGSSPQRRKMSCRLLQNESSRQQ
jgi:hypothetical protein